jgi:UDP-N-acetyl-D-galactosamine dehydrogenase
MAIHQNQKKESTNNQINGLYCSATLRYCGLQLLYHYCSIDKNNRPDLTPLYKSSETVGKVLKKRRHSNL